MPQDVEIYERVAGAKDQRAEKRQRWDYFGGKFDSTPIAKT
jgi:hypothetical protein